MSESIILYFGKDFGVDLSDRTIVDLDSSEVSDNINCEYDKGFCKNIIYEKHHPDGWTIKAKLKADYYVWIEEFEANHFFYGKIKGILNDRIVAESLMAWKNFSKFHPLTEFDCGDI
jgi:hypothetical protein